MTRDAEDPHWQSNLATQIRWGLGYIARTYVRQSGKGVMARHITEEYAKDLDETRRLLYMALLRQRTEKYELAGTLVNALVHHQRVGEDVTEVVRHVLNVIEGLPGDDQSGQWVRAQIDRITEQLDG